MRRARRNTAGVVNVAASLLDAAKGHLLDRADTYDKPEGERSAAQTAKAFNAVTGREGEAALQESDVWLILGLLKDVRLHTSSKFHQDSAEDTVAYRALMGEAMKAGK